MRARLGGEKLAAILPEGAEMPADPAVRFKPGAVHLYADSRLVEEGARP